MKAIENPIISVDASYFAIVAMAQADNDLRYYLNGVSVEPGPNKRGAVMVATNGHYLIAMHDKNGICENQVILKTDKRLLQDCAKRGSRNVVVNSAGVMQVCDSSVVSYQFPEKAFIDGKFPDWRRIIPAQELSAGLPNTVNSEYLKVFLDIGGKLNRKYGAVSFFYDPANMEDGYATGSILVRSSNDDFMGIVMPMRNKVPSVFPAWAKTEEPKEEAKSKPDKATKKKTLKKAA
jgi:hypothetical protein